MRKGILAIALTATFLLGSMQGMCVKAAEPIPVDVVKYQKHYYRIYYGNHRWTDAKKLCEKAGGHLVTITSAKEQAFVEKLNGMCTGLWIGAYRDEAHNWKWVTGEAFDYTNWREGEPSSSQDEDSTEDKASLWNIKQQWNDLNDYEVRGYICEWEPEDIQKLTRSRIAEAQITNLTRKGKRYVYFESTKVAYAAGYQIRFSKKESMKQATYMTTTASKGYLKKHGKRAKFACGKLYFVQIRAFVKNASGKKVYGKWSSIMNFDI